MTFNRYQGPESEETRAAFKKIGGMIGDVVKDSVPGMGFAFLMFDFGAGGTILYLSNAARDDMIKALGELMIKLQAD